MGKDRLFKDPFAFSEPKFEIGQTVKGYIQIFNNDVASQTMGLFYLTV